MQKRSARLAILAGLAGSLACAASDKPAAFRYCTETPPELELELAERCAECPERCSADCIWHFEDDRRCGRIEARERDEPRRWWDPRGWW